jgi:hypothetical protein
MPMMIGHLEASRRHKVSGSHARKDDYFGGNLLNMLSISFESFWIFLFVFEDRSALSVPTPLNLQP